MIRAAIAVLLAAKSLIIELPLLAATPTASPSASRSTASAASKPNLVFVLADQLRYQSCGFAGDAKARTPNLDRLAANGLRFTQCYNTARCWPTRSSLMTGYYALRMGDWKLVSAREREDQWELYDLGKDRSEMHDLAAQQPERARRMESRWKELEQTFRSQYSPAAP